MLIIRNQRLPGRKFFRTLRNCQFSLHKKHVEVRTSEVNQEKRKFCKRIR